MTTEVSGIKTRTRTAIIDASIRALNKDSQAAIADIATEADVGRTTIHRYFPERSDLMEAVAAEGVERLEQASQAADLEKDSAVDALQRLCYGYISHHELLRMAFNGSEASALLWKKWSEESTCNESDKAFVALIERGQREGVFNPDFTSEWMINVFWSLIYASVCYIYDHDFNTHEALQLMTQTLENAFAPRR